MNGSYNPIGRNSMFYSEEDFQMESGLVEDYFEEDLNQTIILYEVDRKRTNVNTTYKEVDETHGGIRFKSPREIPCMFEIKESEIKSYDSKTANGIYSVSGNFEGIVLCRTLDKYHCDIKRGDYIAVQIDTDRKAYFVVTNDGKINTANANYIGAYKTAYRKIEATATTVNEFNGR